MDGKGRRVVVADDEIIMRQVLKSVLEEGHFEVVGEATHGDEVLSKCLKHHPDILCLDINMPRKDGIAAFKEVRAKLPDLQVVMISGNTSSEKVKEAISLGAKGFIVKPFNAGQVLQRLIQLFGDDNATTAKTASKPDSSAADN